MDREEKKKALGSVLKQIIWGGGGLISTLFNGSSHSEWLPPYVVQREAFLCREFHIKVTATKVPKRKNKPTKSTAASPWKEITIYLEGISIEHINYNKIQ